jgi:hypothetical protein
MANYLLLYGGGTMPSEEERPKVMQAWDAWFHTLGGALVDGGNPFTGAAKTISTDGNVSDGAGGSRASGYSVIKADSIDAATRLAKGCPVLQGGAQVMVFETLQVM